ncbi:MAG: DUF1015 domain-containing protein, partial [Candidatus Heimdallarchaeota archaeon]|nr:DUF1015 domain-containing protein [Candidatus Heimdallarchaeota archaeon]
MVDIKPFKGILYNKKRIPEFSEVTAPPYDVISPAEQEALYNQDDSNVIRLILGKDLKGDDEHNNRYTRAASTFNQWLQDGILSEDFVPSIYIYQQEYRLKNGNAKIRTAFITLVKLEPFENDLIRPHEKTLSKPKQDRFNLLKASRATFCQIFSLYSDPKNQINPILNDHTKATAEIEIKDGDGVIHRIWKITDHQFIGDVKEIMEDKTLYIADGHHRYETALKYQQEMKESTSGYSGEELFNYTMMMLVDMNNQELTVLPVHRALKNLNKEDIAELIFNFQLYFDLQIFQFDANNEQDQRLNLLTEIETRGKKKHVFGMYAGDSKYYLLTLKDEKVLDKVLKQQNAENWRKLDVAILHSL